MFLPLIFAFNFCFQIIDFDQSVCREWQIFGLVSAVCFTFMRRIDTSTHPAHLGTIIYWPDWLPAPEPAETSLFCTGNGGKSLVAAKSFCIIPAIYTRTLLSCAVHGGRQEQTRIFGIPVAHKGVPVPPNMLRGSPQPKAATRRNSPSMGS